MKTFSATMPLITLKRQNFVKLFYSVPDPDPNPDPHVFGPLGSGPLVRGMDPDPDPSISKQKYYEKP